MIPITTRKKFLTIPLNLILSCLTITPESVGFLDRPDFFEKGRDQFEEEIHRFEQREGFVEPALQVDLTTLPWSRVVIEKAGFTAQIPPGAITHEVETINAPKGKLNFNILATHPPSSRYVIAYSEKVSPDRFKNAQAVLERARNEIISNNVGLLKTAEDDFTFKNYPGKQFQLKNKDETIVFRLLVVKQYFYVMAVNQQNNAISAKSIDTFFDSFELIN